MATYQTEARVTLPNGKEAVFPSSVEAGSYHEALLAAAFSVEKAAGEQGVKGAGGVTIRVWGPDAPPGQGAGKDALTLRSSPDPGGSSGGE